MGWKGARGGSLARGDVPLAPNEDGEGLQHGAPCCTALTCPCSTLPTLGGGPGGIWGLLLPPCTPLPPARGQEVSCKT